MLASVGGGKKLYSYGYVFNGFAAELTAAQAAKLAATPGVLAVTKDELAQLDTSSTPAFLGLTGADRPLGEPSAKGGNVIIGIVDSGVWPERPSFSDRTGVESAIGTEGRQARLPADPRLARQVRSGRSTSTPPTATRS